MYDINIFLNTTLMVVLLLQVIVCGIPYLLAILLSSKGFLKFANNNLQIIATIAMLLFAMKLAVWYLLNNPPYDMYIPHSLL